MALLRRTTEARGLRVPPPRPAEVAATSDGILRLADRLVGPTTWVFAGGGSHGAVQLGTLQAVAETDLRADAILGTSAGALTGAVVAEDPAAAAHRLVYLWSDFGLSDILSGGWTSLVSPSSLTGGALSDSSGERASLEAVYSARTFDDLVLPLAVVATDLASGQPTLLEHGPLIEALLASSAIPGVFPPVLIEDRWYIDGLASANLAASVAMRRGAGSLVVFDTGSSASRFPGGTSLRAVVPALNNMLTAQQRISSLSQAAARIPVVYPPTPGGLPGALSFSSSIDMAREAYVAGREFLLDLAAVYPSGPLGPGLYARPDAFDGDVPKDILRPVTRTLVGEAGR